MSYINEALKKAQKEKDNRHLDYGGLLETGRKSGRVFKVKTLLWASLGIILIFLAFTLYSWLDFKGTNTVTVREHEKPAKPAEPRAIEGTKALYERARRLHKRGRLGESKKLYQQTLASDPGYVYALNNIGVIYIGEGDYQQAQNSLEEAVRIKPGYVDPHYNLACLHALKGETVKSLSHLQKAASLDKSVRQWARKDADLKNLEGLVEFKEIIGINE